MNAVTREKEHHLGSSGLYTAEYLAESPVSVIFVPPLFEEHPRTRKLLVNTARHLASCGVRAIRFDYAGTGFSLGSATDLSPQSTIRDLEIVSNYIQNAYPSKLLFVGFRYGAHAAIRYRMYSQQDIPCLLWEPVTDLAKYCAGLLRIALVNQVVTLGEVSDNSSALAEKLESGGTLLIDGYPVTSDFYRQCKTTTQSQFLAALSSGNTKAVFWKSKQDHPLFQELQIPSALVNGIRTSWENIRFVDNRPDELLRMTLAWCNEYAV